PSVELARLTPRLRSKSCRRAADFGPRFAGIRLGDTDGRGARYRATDAGAHAPPYDGSAKLTENELNRPHRDLAGHSCPLEGTHHRHREFSIDRVWLCQGIQKIWRRSCLDLPQ